MHSLLNRWVLTLRLKWSILSMFLMQGGRSFHFLGPHTLKERSANVFRDVKGTSSFFVSLHDLKPARLVVFHLTRDCRYSGALLFRHLKTSRMILKSILAGIGSQRNALRHADALSYFLFLRMSFAAIFCTRCSLFSSH